MQYKYIVTQLQYTYTIQFNYNAIQSQYNLITKQYDYNTIELQYNLITIHYNYNTI